MSINQENIVTIFKNIRETNSPFHKDVLFILDRIKNGTNKEHENWNSAALLRDLHQRHDSSEGVGGG